MRKLMVVVTRFFLFWALALFFSLLLTESALAASISASPAQGPAGTKVTVSGKEWPAGDVIDFCWDFNCDPTDTKVTADGNGTFTGTITVPKDAPIGHTYIDAGDQATFKTAQTPFEVTSSGQSQPTPGWYKNSGPATIHEDSSGLRIVWENSYIYQHPGPDNLYWYAQVKYLNTGSQTLPLTCVGASDPSLAKEHIRGTEGIPPDGDGYVSADETFCKRNPNWNGSIGPGGTHYSWAIFHNVPPGGKVALEWGPYPYSPSWVNPWASPFNDSPPAECPPELVALGTCSEFKLPWTRGEEWYYTGGPHYGGASVRSGVDFAPDSQPIRCPTFSADIQSTRWAIAVATGRVVRSDDSIVEIEHTGGLRTGYMHLADIQIQVGDSVQRGDRLGHPSCAVPSGGSTTGVHLHFYFKQDEKHIPADRQVLSGWTIHAAEGDYQGTMTKPNEDTRTADAGRCAPNRPDLGGCTVSNIRNDLISDNGDF